MSSDNQFEIVLGIVGGVGTDFDRVISELCCQFEKKSCLVKVLKLTDFLKSMGSVDGSYINKANDKTEAANTLRNDLPGGMAYIAVNEIFKSRKELINEIKPIIYILSSLKNPAEYEVLRHIYRRNFILLSIYENKESRKRNLLLRQITSLKKDNRNADINDVEESIQKLMDSDECQFDRENNQLKQAKSTINTYHRSHYFVHNKSYVDDVDRFVKLLFNAPFETPTREEQGMAMAYLLSLRSADISRQVGAVIIDDDGNILSTGCNEVPKFGGGLYWHDTTPDLRDYKLCNQGNTLTNLMKEKNIEDVVENLSVDLNESDKKKFYGVVKDSLDYIRAVHAEEAAICDAARRGVSIQGSKICVTTFPCHLCIKHIIAAGIKEVVYIEPYPKSLSEELYKDIVKDKASAHDNNMVKLVPFTGVSPKRYKYVFNKVKSDRQSNGIVVDSENLTPSPKNLSHSTPIGYFWVETLYRKKLLNDYLEHIEDDNCNNVIDSEDTDLFNKLLEKYQGIEVIKGN